MNQAEMEELVGAQRHFFERNLTLDVKFRLRALARLKKYILRNEKEIQDALRRDLGKSEFESYMCETGLVLSEITYMQKHVRRFAEKKPTLSPVSQFYSHSYTLPSPLGVVLIMSPWNYPFLLTTVPLVDALAAGNTAVVKPSAYSPDTAKLLKRMQKECFDEKYVAVITGGREENTHLLEVHFDHIFFTGSKAVGKEVMRHAAKYLTSVTLELGGKSPCIVDKTANIQLAAKRIVFGKYLNCGQTCVAPDYLYCERSVKGRLISEIKRQIQKQFGSAPLENKDYGRIVNRKHFDRIVGLMDEKKVVYGGRYDRESLKIEPTVMDDVTFSDAVMKEEIFGPLLPVLTYDSIEEVIHNINAKEHPLALYIFTGDRKKAVRVMNFCRFGGGCINDTVIHLATSRMPFGGVGESGMGSCHGKAGFDTFTHYKDIVDKKTWVDLSMRYQPYKDSDYRILQKVLR